MENIPTSKLIEEIARKTGLTKKAAGEALRAMAETITDALAGGGRVELRGLASFSVDERAPRKGRNPRTGKPIMIPMTRRVKVRMSEAVKRRVAEQSLSTGVGILVAGGDDPWAEEIVSRLKGIGYDVSVGPTLGDALRASRCKPDSLAFVLVGPSIDDITYSTLAQSLKLSPKMSMLPVALGRADDDALRKPKAVRIMPDGMFDSAEAAETLVRDEVERWREEKHYFGRQVTLRSPSDETSIETPKFMPEEVYKEALADETEAYKTLSAFREAIDNAANHGNGRSPVRYLTVSLMQDSKRIALEVKDEGRGFEHEPLLEAARQTDVADTARERLVRGQAGGLGMKLMAECTDELRFSDGGSRLMLVKLRHAGTATPAGPAGGA
ncbi:MAG: HU family DNA-binding protein [Planctomycetota bacterium]|jgi:DNA-binding protein HU-beta